MKEEELIFNLLPLTQAIKFEKNHYNKLTKFLIRKALSNETISNKLFWIFKSELENRKYSMRYYLILETIFLKIEPQTRNKFTLQLDFVQKIQQIFQSIKNLNFKNSDTRFRILLEEKFKEKFSIL